MMGPVHTVSSQVTRGFWSDNGSGAHPAVLEALHDAAIGHAPSYGADPWSERLAETTREVFGPRAQIFPVFNGTGANVVALQVLLQRWECAVASTDSHVVTDESTAPQLVGGSTVRAVPTPDGKLTPDAARAVFDAYDGTVHHARPAAITLAQSTELGTVYSLPELGALVDLAHARGARVHMDGARLANAAVHLGVHLADAVPGVSVLSFGGTKNGMVFGDALVVLDPDLAEPVDRLRKASAQLASKMRFVAAQLDVLLGTGLWRSNARHANDAARHLAARLRETGIVPALPVQANAVFFAVPPQHAAQVAAEGRALVWDPGTGLVRAVASFDTTEEDVEHLVSTVQRVLGG